MSTTENFETLFNAALESAGASASPSYPKLDCEGTWVVKAVESVYGKNQKGDANRTMIKVEVIANKNDSADKISARTNLYLNVSKDQELTNRNFAPYIKTLLDLGISVEKIKDDATDYFDIAQNIATIITKQIKLGKEIKFDLQLRANKNKPGEFYKNVFVHSDETPAPAVANEKDLFAEL